MKLTGLYKLIGVIAVAAALGIGTGVAVAAGSNGGAAPTEASTTG